MWYELLTSGRIINKPKQSVNELWDDLFDKAAYWRNVIWYDCRTQKEEKKKKRKKGCKTVSHFLYT